jgi:hypothetical protein
MKVKEAKRLYKEEKKTAKKSSIGEKGNDKKERPREKDLPRTRKGQIPSTQGGIQSIKYWTAKFKRLMQYMSQESY